MRRIGHEVIEEALLLYRRHVVALLLGMIRLSMSLKLKDNQPFDEQDALEVV
jgi:hypothetical protein